MYSELIEDVEREVADLAVSRNYVRPGEGDTYVWPWSVAKLMKDVGAVASIDARVDGKGHSPEWPTTVSILVSILRAEKYSLIRARQKEREAELKGSRR
jgi:hypothetical protein